jgi:hypothetical protein
MARKLRRDRAAQVAATCAACGRTKGARKVPRCPRCPGQPIAATLAVEPLMGIRLLVVDPSSRACGAVITSPTIPNRLEMAVTVDPFSDGPEAIAQVAIEASIEDGAPAWLVMEHPGSGGGGAGSWMRPDVLLALGRAMGIFEHAWRSNGGARARVLTVEQVAWSAGMIPGARNRDARKAAAKQLAPLLWGTWTVEAGRAMPTSIAWTDDLAEAGLIASFVRRWPPFIDGIGDRDRAAALRVSGVERAS